MRIKEIVFMRIKDCKYLYQAVDLETNISSCHEGFTVTVI